MTLVLCSACGWPTIPGPRGGAAQNFYCVNRDTCRQGFNVTIHQGREIWRQDIGEVDDQHYSMYRSQCETG